MGIIWEKDEGAAEAEKKKARWSEHIGSITVHIYHGKIKLYRGMRTAYTTQV